MGRALRGWVALVVAAVAMAGAGACSGGSSGGSPGGAAAGVDCLVATGAACAIVATPANSFVCSASSFPGTVCCASIDWPTGSHSECDCASYFSAGSAQEWLNRRRSRRAQGSSGGSGSSSGSSTCTSGPGTCKNGDSSTCSCGTACDRVCATCSYACLRNCSTDSQCAGLTDSSGNPLVCSSCPQGVCNAGFSACRRGIGPAPSLCAQNCAAMPRRPMLFAAIGTGRIDVMAPRSLRTGLRHREPEGERTTPAACATPSTTRNPSKTTYRDVPTALSTKPAERAGAPNRRQPGALAGDARSARLLLGVTRNHPSLRR